MNRPHVSRSPRILYYSHDTYGLGHLSRSLALAKATARRLPRAQQMIVTGSPVARDLGRGAPVELVLLPPVIKVGPERYAPREPGPSLESVLALRARALLAAARRFRPDLVVIDSRLELPLDAKLWSVPERRVLVYTASADAARQQALEAQGAAVICLPNAAGKVALDKMLGDLGRREFNDLHVEAGFKLNGSLLRESLVDELLVYQAPRLMGEGAGIAAIGPFEQLTDTQALQWRSVERVGDDLRLLARLPGRDVF